MGWVESGRLEHSQLQLKLRRVYLVSHHAEGVASSNAWKLQKKLSWQVAAASLTGVIRMSSSAARSSNWPHSSTVR